MKMDKYKFFLIADKTSFSVYKDMLTDCEPLRSVTGAHKDIVLMRTEPYFSIIATGT
jgi:hypothetical protein